MKLLRTKTVKRAHKAHECHFCECIIPAKAGYLVFSFASQSTSKAIITYKAHHECAELFERLTGQELCPGVEIDPDGPAKFYVLMWDSLTDHRRMINKMYNEPDLFFVGYREILEKPGRNGYTTKISEAGRYTLEEAKSMTAHGCAHGKARWFIACEALETFNSVMGTFSPSSAY